MITVGEKNKKLKKIKKVSKKVINNLLIYFQNKQNMNFNVFPKGSFNLGEIKEINK